VESRRIYHDAMGHHYRWLDNHKRVRKKAVPSKENTDSKNTLPSAQYIVHCEGVFKRVQEAVEKLTDKIDAVNIGHKELNAYVRNGLTHRITVATRLMVGVGIMVLGAMILHFFGVGT